MVSGNSIRLMFGELNAVQIIGLKIIIFGALVTRVLSYSQSILHLYLLVMIGDFWWQKFLVSERRCVFGAR